MGVEISGIRTGAVSVHRWAEYLVALPVVNDFIFPGGCQEVSTDYFGQIESWAWPGLNSAHADIRGTGIAHITVTDGILGPFQVLSYSNPPPTDERSLTWTTVVDPQQIGIRFGQDLVVVNKDDEHNQSKSLFLAGILAGLAAALGVECLKETMEFASRRDYGKASGRGSKEP
jgi:hypothetical protein